MGLVTEAIPGSLTRALKRHRGEVVSVKDYSTLWAETTASGDSQVVNLQPDKIALKPAFALVARVLTGTDQWQVTKEKLVLRSRDIVSEAMLQQRSDFFNSFTSMSYGYEVIADLGVMEAAEMVRVLRAADSTERIAGHISGLSRSKQPLTVVSQPTPDDGTRMTYNS